MTFPKVKKGFVLHFVGLNIWKVMLHITFLINLIFASVSCVLSGVCFLTTALEGEGTGTDIDMKEIKYLK